MGLTLEACAHNTLATHASAAPLRQPVFQIAYWKEQILKSWVRFCLIFEWRQPLVWAISVVKRHLAMGGGGSIQQSFSIAGKLASLQTLAVQGLSRRAALQEKGC